MNKKALLIILDGWGHSPDPAVSAIAQAHTPFMDNLYKTYPNAELVTYGEAVGLPEGQMGNSEVGHLNIGAGRVVYQELARINKAINSLEITRQPGLQKLVDYAKEHQRPVHLLGLLSDGGVHSHIDHIIYISRLLAEYGVDNYIHAFLDGRDTSPYAGKTYLKKLLDSTNPDKSILASVIGRYYAMDRDRRWDRVKKAYDLLVNGVGLPTYNVVETIEEHYDKGNTDEFMEALVVDRNPESRIKDGDPVFFINFRTDRPRQLTEVLSQKDHPEYEMKKLDLFFTTMTEYDQEFRKMNIIFQKEHITQTIGEVIANNRFKQLRIAETEKYPHVTYFLSGGREEMFPGESRILIESPKVSTYDLQPEMSAKEVTEKTISHIEEASPEFIVLNYANADMVGHTGVFDAAVKAVEKVDDCLSQLIPRAMEKGYSIVIIADHGNSDCMINPDGSPHTAHTKNPVPIIVLDPGNRVREVNNGALADIAPTLLSLMQIEIPKRMTGKILAVQD